ncbi:hypothetical protein L3V86_07615 [Thiotrichales bacterium 19S11-10]|nr:hypothetical protein [Thiotrichales bacterium 19S11-10]
MAGSVTSIEVSLECLKDKKIPEHIIFVLFDGCILQKLSENEQQQDEFINNLPKNIKQVSFSDTNRNGYNPSDELIKKIIDRNIILCSDLVAYQLVYQKYNCLVLGCYKFIQMDIDSFREKMNTNANKLYIMGGLSNHDNDIELIIKKFKILDKKFTFIDLRGNDLLTFGTQNLARLIKELPNSVKYVSIYGNGFDKETDKDRNDLFELFEVFHQKNIEVIAEHQVVHEYHNYCKQHEKIVSSNNKYQVVQDSSSKPLSKKDNQGSSSPPYLVYSAGLILAAAAFYNLYI